MAALFQIISDDNGRSGSENQSTGVAAKGGRGSVDGQPTFTTLGMPADSTFGANTYKKFALPAREIRRASGDHRYQHDRSLRKAQGPTAPGIGENTL